MDQNLFIALNSVPKPPLLDVVMAALSSWAVWWPLVVIAGVGFLLFGGFRARAMVISAVLAIGINDGLLCRTLKKTVQRPRPHEVLSGVRTIDLAKATPRVKVWTVGKSEEGREFLMVAVTDEANMAQLESRSKQLDHRDEEDISEYAIDAAVPSR